MIHWIQKYLPDEKTETCLFYFRLNHDADKLDIWKLVTDYYNSGNARRNVAMVLDLPKLITTKFL